VITARLENPISARLRNPRVTGFLGILLGVVAAFLTIPPIQARTTAWPVAVGLVAAIFGIWTVTRGRRRLGYGAVAAGILGIGLGILATRSGVGHLNATFDAQLIGQTFAFSTPLIFAAIGGMFSERSGVVNIGLEGMMLMGAFWGVYGADKGGSWVIGLLVAMGVGGLLALIYAYFAIHLRADQIVGGTAVNFLALGITGYFFFQLYNGNYIPNGVSTIPNLNIPGSGTSTSSAPRSAISATWCGRGLRLSSSPMSSSSRRRSACGSAPAASIRARPTPSASTSTRSVTGASFSRECSPHSAACTCRTPRAAGRSSTT